MHSTLNKVIGKNHYSVVPSPSTATLKGAFVRSINAGYPLAVSTVEFGGSTVRYNNHPRTTGNIGHWIVGRGHNDSGNQILFMDPAATKTVFPQASPTSTHSTSGFQKFVATNGIVY